MKISSRFTIAIHVLLCIDAFNKEYKTTSDFIASSVNVNPVIIRRILGQLKEAGIIEVTRGSGGARIIKPYDKITLLDIFKAVDSIEDGLFNFQQPNPDCPVGKKVHVVLDSYLENAQSVFEKELSKIAFMELSDKMAKNL